MMIARSVLGLNCARRPYRVRLDGEEELGRVDAEHLCDLRGTALNNVKSYETTGLLSDSLITLHTLADPVVTYCQEPLYAAKVQAQGSSSQLAQIPTLAYGHCSVNAAQAKTALLVMLVKAGR